MPPATGRQSKRTAPSESREELWTTPSGVAIHIATHYEGEKGAERVVRVVTPSGAMVAHYEGEKGAERVVRAVHPSGVATHYEGERGAERVL